MQDRVSLYPGRVKLIPVAGQDNTYDMVRADSPTQEGTPLNKASLLKDATAALYGLTEEAVPDDVLVQIKSLLNDNETLANSKAQIEFGTYVGTGIESKTINFSATPKIVFVYKDEYRPASSAINTNNYSYGYDALTIFMANVTTIPSFAVATGTGAIGNAKLNYTLANNKLTWSLSGGYYSYNNSAHALNSSGVLYKYLAII